MREHMTDPVWPDAIAEDRFAATIRRGSPEGCRVALFGVPDDTGVRLNRGRPGAAEGPTAFRAALARYAAAEPDGWTWPAVYDAGDLVPAPGTDESAMHETHRQLTVFVAGLLDRNLMPVMIGGGHDLTLGLVRAVAARYKNLGGVYFDAHLDVRDTPGSGMAFRRLAEDCGVVELNIFGINPLVNSAEHVEWFRSHGGRIHPRFDRGDGDRLDATPGDLFVSFDLDVIDASAAPGVSAMNPAGWSAADAAAAVYVAGRDPRVRCFDLMELNPVFDEGGRTARLAAHLLLMFLRGVAERGR